MSAKLPISVLTLACLFIGTLGLSAELQALDPPPPTSGSNCSGITTAPVPSPPNSTIPDFGVWMKVIASYSSTTNCSGHATKNAITNTYSTFPTEEMSDGYRAYVSLDNDTQDRPRSLLSGAEAAQLGMTGAAFLTHKNSGGSVLNTVRIQDTLDCTATGTDPATLDIKM